MNDMTEYYLFLQALAAHSDRLRELLADDWPTFQDELYPLLRELDAAEEETETLSVVDEIIELLLESPAAQLARALLRQAQGEAGTIDDATRSVRMRDPTSGATRSIGAKGAPLAGRDDVVEAAFALRQAVFPVEEAMVGEAEEARHLNTFFAAAGEDAPLSPEQPLVYNHAYVLYVEISPQRRGLGEEDRPFPENVLAEVWEEQETLPLTVWVASHDFDVEPQLQTMALPRFGPTAALAFNVLPRRREDWGHLLVQVYYGGHLLQAVRVEAYVAPVVGTAAPTGVRPVQTARTTFTATSQLDPDELLALPERVLTVNVQRDPRDGSLDLLFLDRTGAARQDAFYDTHLQPEALGEAISAVRRQLKQAITGRKENGVEVKGYSFVVNGNRALINEWLPRLALVGHQLYRQLLPASGGGGGAEAESGRLQALLQPWAVIQVNPVVGRVTIPWALLYERPVKFLPGKTRVCEGFAACGPDCAGCPSEDDPYIICPYAFWGYRYAIEQIPCWVTGELPQLPTLIRQIDNGRPLHINLNVWRDFALWQEHRQKLEAAGNVKLLVAEEVGEMEQLWRDDGNSLDIVYFYTHGGHDDFLGPYLQLSDAPVNSDFLEASSLTWPRAPLVFLNGCATGDYGPDSYVSLIDDFREAGASGVVGTECPVPELFAEAYAAALFSRLFRGEPLGQAMLAVRLNFLRQHLNPLGLVYTPYAAHEVALARPVADPSADN